MSSVPELLTFGVGVDTSPAEEGLASLGGAAQGAAADIQTNMSGASDSLKDLGRQSSGASRGILGLASVIALISPRLGATVRSFGTLARGVGVLRLGLGPAAAALTVVVAAVGLYQRKQAELEKQERRSIAMAGALVDIRQQLRDATLDLDVEIGNLTRSERELLEIRQEAFVTALPRMAEFTVAMGEQADKVADARENLSTLTEAAARVGERLDGAAEGARALSTASQGAKLRDVALDLQAQEAALASIQGDQAKYIQGIKDLISTRKEELELSERNSRSNRAEIETIKTLSSEQVDYASILEQIAGIEKQAVEARMSDEQRVIALMNDRLVALREIAAINGGIFDTEQAAHAVRMQAAAELDALKDAAAKKRKAETREALGEASDLYSGIAAAAISAAERRADGDEAAMERAKETARRLGIVEVGIATAVGISNSIARYAGRPVATALAVGAQIATGIAQAAAINSAHQGATLAPDEVSDPRGFTRLRGERDNGAGQVLSPEASRRMERGEGSGAATIPIPVYQHFGAFFADVVQGGQSPLTDAINAGRTVGRRGY
jgi:hypothetical protein